LLEVEVSGIFPAGVARMEASWIGQRHARNPHTGPIMSAQPLSSPRLYDPDVAPRGVHLKQLCKMYCREHPQISNGAKQQYHVAVNLCRRWLLDLRRQTTCSEVFSLARFLDFAAWLAAPLDGTPHGKCRSAPTINGRLDTLWMLWEFAEEENVSGPRPNAKKRPRWREPKYDPVAWTGSQVVDLIAACVHAPRMRSKKARFWTGDFWATFVGCLLATGERFDAMLHCPRSALAENVLTVPAHLTKDLKEKPIVLPDWIAQKLRSLTVVAGSDLFWPYPLRSKQLLARYTLDVLTPARLPTTRKHKFHCLRRTTATQVYIMQGLEAARDVVRHGGEGLTLTKYISRAVVQQETGTPSYNVPAPTKQMKLF
jgi:hypothetical protein